ncbi:phosphotransferase family protein [Actinocatenispora rupis]|uniref:Aminoglycoside phosphotransferase n=1 Tax=Actinocatenispora rupis TaxID=519421 RepID=A0A8J3IXL8_9ACTN|nr:aminoglycoside phosphotransferase family protein [Actinocatenispora rupis]GID10538.1 aminoglycoside phosphotransferase [Actinocatenispora rupis]
MTAPAALAWAAAACGTDLHPVRPLPGGTHAATTLVRTGDGRQLVLRTFPPGDPAVHREADVLARLAGLDGLAPALVAADPDGTHAGRPAILVTRVPGRPDITPADPYRWAERLGRVLARIHAGDPTGRRRVIPAEPAAYLPAAVRDGWATLAGAPEVLTHHDFWSGNTLWTGAELTGVVDWSGAARAPRGFDVSWCRLDLVLLYDPAVADAFTTAYGPVDDLALWDTYAAGRAARDVEDWSPNYVELGRTDLTPTTLRRRLTDWTRRLVP